MNKYQEALEFLRSEDVTAWGNDKIELLYFHLDNIEELVDKATPKKPPKEYVVDGTHYICPSCGYLIETYSNMHDKNYKRVVINTSCYCSKCGQKLDWRNEELN